MTPEEMWFVITLILNTLVAVVYLIVQRLRSKSLRKSCIVKAAVMCMCPIVGPLGLFVAHFSWRIFRKSVDLSDVVFGKERVATHKVPEEEKEINMVPMEDAIAVSNRENLRDLMMKVVCDDTGESLGVIRKGLQAEDSETSHYAATILQEKLGVFRRHVQSAFLQLQNTESSESRATQAAELLEYMIPMLKRDVLDAVELSSLVQTMDTTAEFLLADDKDRIDVCDYDDLFHIALEANEYTIAEKWCNRLVIEHPATLSAYSCRLHLYYKQNRGVEFRETLEELKKSEIVVDAQLLDWIRLFK